MMQVLYGHKYYSDLSLDLVYDKYDSEIVFAVFSGVGDAESSVHLGKFDKDEDFYSEDELFSGLVDWDGGYKRADNYSVEEFETIIAELAEEYGY